VNITTHHYTILLLLGEGASGRVSLAENAEGTPVAIKQGMAKGLEQEQTILTHIQAQGQVEGIPRLLEAWVGNDERMSLVLDYIPGQPMRNIPRYSLSMEVVMQYITDFCTRMVHLHQRGVVHYDLHNGNVLLGSDGHIYLIDFGIARFVDQQQPGAFRYEVTDMICLIEHWLTLFVQDDDHPCLKQAVLDWLHERLEHIYNDTGCNESALTFLEDWRIHLASLATTEEAVTVLTVPVLAR
jgi:serine/threonine protein kinase